MAVNVTAYNASYNQVTVTTYDDINSVKILDDSGYDVDSLTY